jgi:propanediol dehydratase small subunit
MSRALALVQRAKPGRRFAWRARHLTKDRTRRRLATGLERAIDSAQLPPQSITAAVPVQREAVIACQTELLALAERLRAPEPVYAQGVALVAELLGTADSPLYQYGADLRGAVRAASAALDGRLD